MTEAPSPLAGTTATLKGELNPGVATEKVTYHFAYSPAPATTCTESGLTAPAGPFPEAAGNHKTVTQAVSGLEGSTEYTVCLIAASPAEPAESTQGTSKTFTTLAEKPLVVNQSTSGVTPFEARLEATVNAENQSTTCEFQYGTDPSLATSTPVPCEQASFEGGEQGIDLPVSGLTPGTTYYYRVLVTNGTGTTKGTPIESFTTQGKPVVTTGEAQNITQTTATFSGTVDPFGAETTYRFAYIDQAGYEKALAGDAEEKADPYAEGETTTPVSAGSSYEPQAIPPTPAAGLLPGQVYHYRLVAQNEFEGTVEVGYGQDATFTTQPPTPPLVSTGGASAVSQNTATLAGTVTTNGLQTNYGFEIGTSPGNYGPATGLGAIGGSQTETVSVTLGELQPGTTYYYRVTATNADGTVQGQPQSFTTPGFPTLVTTPTAPPLVAYTSPGFPSETANTQSPSIEVVSHKVKGKTATIKVSVPSAGKLVATGKGVSKGTGKASKAEDVTVKVSLTKKEQAFLAKHKGHKRKVSVKLVFTPTSGSQLTTSVTVLVG